jgi:site-specific DNA-methyltransferase (adenine-specific)
MACAIEDAGFEIRDCLFWAYGSGFPKSHDVSKGIDKAAGAERDKIRVTNVRNPKATGGGRDGAEGATRPWIEAAMARGYHEKDGDTPATPEAEQWQGWGTALKPALEPICLARKPLSEKSVAANVLKHGTGAINIDGCRVGFREKPKITDPKSTSSTYGKIDSPGGKLLPDARWPANLLHDSSDEVLAGFPYQKSGENKPATKAKEPSVAMGNFATANVNHFAASEGSAARFFYSAKAGPLDRIGTAHATVKPVDLMRWLCRLVTPPGGHILEPFAGSGTTGIAAMAEGFDCSMIELEADHVADIERKLAFLRGEGALTFQEHNHAKALRTKETPLGGLFGEAA